MIGFDRRLRDLPPPKWEEEAAIAITYAFHVVAVISVTGPLKAILKRPRPENPRESNDP